MFFKHIYFKLIVAYILFIIGLSIISIWIESNYIKKEPFNNYNNKNNANIVLEYKLNTILNDIKNEIKEEYTKKLKNQIYNFENYNFIENKQPPHYFNNFDFDLNNNLPFTIDNKYSVDLYPQEETSPIDYFFRPILDPSV